MDAMPRVPPDDIGSATWPIIASHLFTGNAFWGSRGDQSRPRSPSARTYWTTSGYSSTRSRRLTTFVDRLYPS